LGVLGAKDRDEEAFRTFVARVEPRLHSAFIAVYGHQNGREATAEALAYAWEHWQRVESMANPAGYLYRVGQSRIRTRKTPVVFVRPQHSEVFVEPNLAKALAGLSERQRVVFVLVHGEGWTLSEVGDLLGLSVPTVQKHAERAMAALRRALRVGSVDGSR
jgi:DNA-directed RNA polymerase specialized sigma24 family protein